MIDPNHFIETHYTEIEDAVQVFCKKRKIEDSEDTLNELILKLLENEGAVLKGFRQENQIKTFIFTLLSNAYYDKVRQEKGRWTVSKVAQKQGKLAEDLDQLKKKDPLTKPMKLCIPNHNPCIMKIRSSSFIEPSRKENFNRLSFRSQ